MARLWAWAQELSGSSWTRDLSAGNKYSNYLGAATPEVVAAANGPKAIGGYAEGVTVATLDASWPNAACRDATPRATDAPWPAVVFSHGSGAYRASSFRRADYFSNESRRPPRPRRGRFSDESRRPPRPRRGRFSDGSRRRHGRDVESRRPRGWDVEIPLMNRRHGWDVEVPLIKSRRRRRCDVDNPWRRFRNDAAAATWMFRGDGPRRLRREDFGRDRRARLRYIYWTEYLASHGYVVAACDHPGSARFTLHDGVPVTPGGARSERARMERDRVADVGTVLDGLEKLSTTDSRFAGRVDASNAAVTGMSFGGYTTCAYLEKGDARVKAAVSKCPSIAMSDGGRLAAAHAATTPCAGRAESNAGWSRLRPSRRRH